MKYTVIDGCPTDKYGMVIARQCKWCGNTVEHNQIRYGLNKTLLVKKEMVDFVNRDIFCTVDCKEEYVDWMYFRNLKIQKEGWKKRYFEKYKHITPIKRIRKEYWSEYYQKNKEKRKCQMLANYYLKKSKKIDNVSTVINS